MSRMPRPAPGSTEESFRHKFEGVSLENNRLRQRIEALERENRDLRKSVYDLNLRYGVCCAWCLGAYW